MVSFLTTGSHVWSNSSTRGNISLRYFFPPIQLNISLDTLHISERTSYSSSLTYFIKMG